MPRPGFRGPDAHTGRPQLNLSHVSSRSTRPRTPVLTHDRNPLHGDSGAPYHPPDAKQACHKLIADPKPELKLICSA